MARLEALEREYHRARAVAELRAAKVGHRKQRTCRYCGERWTGRATDGHPICYVTPEFAELVLLSHLPVTAIARQLKLNASVVGAWVRSVMRCDTPYFWEVA